MTPGNAAATDSPTSQLQQQIDALIERLADDLAACDLQWTLFVAAAQSIRYDSKLSPYPGRHVLRTPTSDGDRFDRAAILRLIVAVPELRSIVWPQLHADVVDLLHWVLCEHGADTVRMHSVPAPLHADVLAKVACADRRPRPSHVFRIEAGGGDGNGDTASAAEERFRAHLDDGRRRTLFAFHGSRLESFHSISAHGLQQHLCKQALFGDGIYLSSELHVSLPFSPIGGGWPGTELGGDLSCMAVCEFVDHELHLKRRATGES